MNPSRIKPNLKTAQLMFEPAPPPENRPPHHECPMMRRRVQSAKSRISTSQTEKQVDKLSYHEFKLAESVRPKSAITTHERVKTPGNLVKSKEANKKNQKGNKPPRARRAFLPVDGIDLHPATYSLDRGIPSHEKLKNDVTGQTNEYPYKLDSTIPECQQENSTKPCVVQSQKIPSGIESLAEWIVDDMNDDLCGLSSQECLIFIPCLHQQRETLATIPPPQDCLDQERCKLIPPPPKPYDPKDLFHYDVAKHIRQGQQSCSHAKQGQIYGIDGKLMHDARHYGESRSPNIIQKEIQDLENLLKGIGNRYGCSVVQYQNEINVLQTTIKKTFEMCDELREAHGLEANTEVPDMFGFRQLSREHDLVISQIRARREVCVEELSKLEASLGMTFQNELVQTYKDL